MKRFHSTTANDINYALSLVFDPTGGARLVRGAPALKPHEREMRLSITLPKSIFQTPSLTAAVRVKDGDDYSKSVKVVEQKATEALQSALKGDFKLVVVQDNAKT